MVKKAMDALSSVAVSSSKEVSRVVPNRVLHHWWSDYEKPSINLLNKLAESLIKDALLNHKDDSVCD